MWLEFLLDFYSTMFVFLKLKIKPLAVNKRISLNDNSTMKPMHYYGSNTGVLH